MTRPLKVHPSIKSADLFPKMRSMKEQVRAPLLPILGALYGRFLRSKAGRPVWSFNLETLEDLIDMSSYILYQTQVFAALEIECLGDRAFGTRAHCRRWTGPW